MARARNLKPGFFRNADLVELSFEYRLLFQGLWILADREGRLEDRPKQIKMEIFPADSVDVNNGLNALQDIGVIVRYEVDGKKYIQVVNFRKHQNPHKDERASSIPPHNEHHASTVQTRCETQKDTVAIGLNPESLLPITDSKTPKPPESLSLPCWLEKSVWEDFLRHRGKKFTLKAQELSIAKLEAMRRKGHDPTQVINNSIANGWKGLFEPKGDHAKPNSKYDPAVAAVERLRRTNGVAGSPDASLFDDVRGEVYEHVEDARTRR